MYTRRCERCGQVFMTPHETKAYCTEACRKRAERTRYRKSHPDTAMTRPFLAWDGEGENGKYTLLANSKGQYLEDRNGLSTVQCLAFLLSNGAGEVNNIWFSFSYDVAMILHDLPWQKIEELHATNECSYKGYHIKYIPKKILWVKQRKRSFVSYDTFGFFQTSFIKTVKAWVGEVPPLITEGKEARETFSQWPMERIREYNHLECKLLVETMDRFRKAVIDAGMSVKSWHGAGALAASYLQKIGAKDWIATPPEPMVDSIMRAYTAGRIEIAGWGYVEPIYHADINSAYPYATTKLLDLSRLTWHLHQSPSTNPIDDWGLYHVKWHLPHLVREPWGWGPFAYRKHDGGIIYPPTGEGWYWGVELAAARRRFPAGITVLEAWLAEGRRVTPFKEDLERGTALRLRFKKEGNPAATPLKLAWNSLYGQFARKGGRGERGVPPFRSYIWAGWITAHCRAQISDAICQAGGRVVCVMTDSVWSAVPLDLDFGGGLGQWSFESEDHGIALCGAGLYQAYDAEGFPRQGEYRSRGFSSDQGDPLSYDRIIRLWNESITECREAPQMAYTLRRFIGIGQAVRQKKLRPYFCQFIDVEKQLENLALYGQTKRVGSMYLPTWREGQFHLMPPQTVETPGMSLALIPEDLPCSYAYRPWRAEASSGPDVADIIAAKEDDDD